jgi:hypothetical protein
VFFAASYDLVDDASHDIDGALPWLICWWQSHLISGDSSRVLSKIERDI